MITKNMQLNYSKIPKLNILIIDLPEIIDISNYDQVDYEIDKLLWHFHIEDIKDWPSLIKKLKNNNPGVNYLYQYLSLETQSKITQLFESSDFNIGDDIKKLILSDLNKIVDTTNDFYNKTIHQAELSILNLPEFKKNNKKYGRSERMELNRKLINSIIENVDVSFPKIIFLNFKNLEYINSTGWGMIIEKINVTKRNNSKLQLVEMQDGIYYDTFLLLEFDHIIEYRQNLKEAIVDYANLHYLPDKYKKLVK